jgi:uncharacterized protein (TIGR02145 family)
MKYRNHFQLSVATAILCFIFMIPGCKKEEKENQLPTVSITSPENGESFTIGTTVVLAAEPDDKDGSIAEVRFYIDDIGISLSTYFPYNYSWNTADETAGDHIIKVIVKDDIGDTCSAKISITLTPAGSPPVASFIASTTNIVMGDRVSFTDQSENEPTGWNWNFGDGSTSTEQSPTHTYNIDGIYTVSLNVSNSFGSDSESKTNYITVTKNTVIDNDGNTYNTVTLGKQVWMAENLKTTHYNDGSEIPLITDATVWNGLATPAYCWYENDFAYKNIYGALYNWYTVLNSKLCPTGWHVPTDAEWTTLANYLANNGYGYQGSGIDISKSLAATWGWNTSSEAGTPGNEPVNNNSSGFTALPGGGRDHNGSYYYLGSWGLWWSSTGNPTNGARHRGMIYDNSYFNILNSDMRVGFSIRCVKD